MKNWKCSNNFFKLSKTIKNVTENIFFFILLTIILIIPSCLCSVYKLAIYLVLKLKHGKKFYGMMDGGETIWAIQEKSRGQIITMFIQEYNQEINGNIIKSFQRQVDQSIDLKRDCPKLFCRRGYFMGYYYFHQDYNLKLIKAMQEYKNIDDLRQLLCEYGSSNEPLGEDDDKMMEVLVGTTPIQWKSQQDNQNRHYPVIVRAHHSLGDGVSMNCLFIKALMKHPTEFLKDTYKDMIGTRKEIINRKLLETKPDQNCILRISKMIWNLISKKRYAPPILRRYDRHVLHGKALSGQKNLVWNSDPNSEYVVKVKNIKRRLGNGASFNSVIFAAISSTFNEYFHQNCSKMDIPKVITSSLVTLPKIPKFNEMVKIGTKNGNIESIDMTNKYVVCALKLPMTRTSEHVGWDDKVRKINREIEKLKESLDIPVLILCNRVIAKLLPAPCVKLLMRGFNTTFGISNLPGFDRGQLFHGGYIEDVYFWIPNSIKIGIGVSIFSSKNRLEMGLIVDKVLIPELDDTQKFLDRIVHHIDEMDKITLKAANTNKP